MPSCVSGVNILWDGVSFLELKVPPKFRNRMCGLCGNYDGDKANDFYGRDGTGLVHGGGQAFGDDWRVGGLRACSVLPRDMPTVSERHCTQTWEAKIKVGQSLRQSSSNQFVPSAKLAGRAMDSKQINTEWGVLSVARF